VNYADFYQGRVLTIVLSQEVQDYLQHPRSKNFAKKAEAYLRRLADRGKEGMTDPETFRHEGEGIWALKPQPVRIYGWFHGPGNAWFVGAVAIKKEGAKMDPGDFEKTKRLRAEYTKD